jgi:hypothetical protein
LSVGFYGSVKMHDAVPHAAERLLEISGTAAQVAVAQKLVADYLVTEQQQGQAEQQQQQVQQQVGPGGICFLFCPNSLCLIPQIQHIKLGLCTIMPNYAEQICAGEMPKNAKKIPQVPRKWQKIPENTQNPEKLPKFPDIVSEFLICLIFRLTLAAGHVWGAAAAGYVRRAAAAAAAAAGHADVHLLGAKLPRRAQSQVEPRAQQ